MDLDLRGGLVKKGARLSFRFSQHCYSRGPSVGEAIPAGWRIPEGPGDTNSTSNRNGEPPALISRRFVPCHDPQYLVLEGRRKMRLIPRAKLFAG